MAERLLRPERLREPAKPLDHQASMIETLENTRARVHRWLDELALLIHNTALPIHGNSQNPENEQAARQALWLERFEELENDRRRLAEAWQRLEQERLELPRSQPGDTPPLRRTETVAPTPAPGLTHASADDHANKAVLNQFRLLRRDVRRATEARSAE